MVQRQGGRCAICKKVPKKLVVDHNHVTGELRGLLCLSCNFCIGNAHDDVSILQSAIDYLVVFTDTKKVKEGVHA